MFQKNNQSRDFGPHVSGIDHALTRTLMQIMMAGGASWPLQITPRRCGKYANMTHLFVGAKRCRFQIPKPSAEFEACIAVVDLRMQATGVKYADVILLMHLAFNPFSSTGVG